MKIKLPANNDQAPRSKKGSVVVRVRGASVVLTKWPTGRGPSTTGDGLYREQTFAWAGSWATNPEPIAYQSAINIAKGTQYVPRDILTLASLGILFTFTKMNGYNLESARLSNPNPQYILDMVGDTPGSILRRDPIGWVLLLPGDEGDALSMHAGFPHWLPQQSPSSAKYVLVEPYAALPNASILASTASIILGTTGFPNLAFQRAALTGDVTAAQNANALTIAAQAVTYSKLQNIAATSRVLARKTAGAGSAEECTLTEVLDFIGGATWGDILYRGSSGWSRLGAGTVGEFMQTQGTAANPRWATPTAGGGVDVQTFATPGTFTGLSGYQKPIGTKLVEVYVVGGGGGGGAGRRGPTSENSSGGGGGGGSGVTWTRFLAAALPSTVDVTVGTGGPGGIAQTTNATNGAAGTAGTDSYFGARSTSAYYVVATGGQGGVGGSTSLSSGGSAGQGRTAGTTGGAGDNVTNGNPPSASNILGPTGGGGACGAVATSRTSRNGGAGGQYSTAAGFNSLGHTNTVAAGGVGSTKVNAQAGNQSWYEVMIGQGGGGGWYNNDGTAGDGAAGAQAGGGGGGGGPSNNGITSGKGGPSGDGMIVVFSYS